MNVPFLLISILLHANVEDPSNIHNYGGQYHVQCWSKVSHIVFHGYSEDINVPVTRISPVFQVHLTSSEGSRIEFML